jgi:hypothetical protein
MSYKADIRTAIRKLSGTDQEELYAIPGTVTAVNGKTCNVAPLDESGDLLEMRLQADDVTGLLITPKVGSLVFVTMMSKTDGFVSMFSAVEKVEINGSEFGGLVNAKELKQQLDHNNAILNTILQVIGTPVNEAGGGAPSVFQAALNVALTGKQTGNFSNIENETVTHGKG